MLGSAEKKGRGRREQEDINFYRRSSAHESAASSIIIMGRDPVEHAKRANKKPPAMRVRGDSYTKKSPFRYNEVVQANI